MTDISRFYLRLLLLGVFLVSVGLVWPSAPVSSAAPQATNIHTSGTLPANCTVGNIYLKTGSSPGMYLCLATDTWTGPLSAAAAGITDLTGDVTGTGPGSTAATIAANAVSDAKFRQSAALSVVGRSANSTGNTADITAGSDHQVLRRSGTALGFGSVNLAESAAVTGVLPVANGGTGVTNGAALMVTSTTLTDAQIKALPSTPITLVAAPGSGYRIKPVSATVVLNASAGAYTNINTTASANLYIQANGGYWLSTQMANDDSLTTAMTALTDFLGTAHAKVWDVLFPGAYPVDTGASGGEGWLRYFSNAGMPSPADVDNHALEIAATNGGSGNYTGGNAANTMTVRLYYTAEAVP